MDVTRRRRAGQMRRRVGFPGCEGLSPRWTHFQAGQRTSSSSRRMTVRLMAATLTWRRQGLVCLDVRDPPHTRRISRRANGRHAHRLVVEGHLLVVVVRGGGLTGGLAEARKRLVQKHVFVGKWVSGGDRMGVLWWSGVLREVTEAGGGSGGSAGRRRDIGRFLPRDNPHLAGRGRGGRPGGLALALVAGLGAVHGHRPL